MTERENPRGERDRGFDGLRAVACLLGFLFHLDAETGLAGEWLRGGGVAGVYTFIVLSGFLCSCALYPWHPDVIGWIGSLHVHAAVAALVAFLITFMIATSWLLIEKPASLLRKAGGLRPVTARSPAALAAMARRDPGQA